MDHEEKKNTGQRSRYANQSEVTETERPLLATPTGRQPSNEKEISQDTGDDEAIAVIAEEIYEKSVGSRPRSDVTDFHDPGTDEEETSDGLNATEEAARHATEDVATGANPTRGVKKVPVFDRASLPPKI